MPNAIEGVYAAVTTARELDGAINEGSLYRNITFLSEKGIQGFAINGATGEYCLTSAAELRLILGIVRKASAGRANVLCGIGSAGLLGSIEFGEIAIDAGSQGLLLPMPHFFPYEQDDLEAYCKGVAEQFPNTPILLYNLPFATPLSTRTVHELIGQCPNIVGIKDSSGSLDILRSLTSGSVNARRIVGSDGVLAKALREGCCDGVVSGVAGVFPEPIMAIYQSRSQPNSPAFVQAGERLREFIERITPLPVPWGLKWIAEARGIAPATFSQPVSARRREQAQLLKEWFRSWEVGRKA